MVLLFCACVDGKAAFFPLSSSLDCLRSLSRPRSLLSPSLLCFPEWSVAMFVINDIICKEKATGGQIFIFL